MVVGDTTQPDTDLTLYLQVAQVMNAAQVGPGMTNSRKL
jgi:hypothetical protein